MFPNHVFNGGGYSVGSFNWRLGFIISRGTVDDAEVLPTIAGTKPDPTVGAIRTPIMPGGLFAMDRKFFFEIGDGIGYDPGILVSMSPFSDPSAL